MMKIKIATACALFAVAGVAETVKVVDSARDPALDEWSAADAKFACAVMEDVFKAAKALKNPQLRERAVKDVGRTRRFILDLRKNKEKR